MPHKTSAIISIPEYLIIRSFSTLFFFPSEKIECQSSTGDDQNRDSFESATHINAERMCPWEWRGVFGYSKLSHSLRHIRPIARETTVLEFARTHQLREGSFDKATVNLHLFRLIGIGYDRYRDH
jgi:hypothetical protein